MAFKMIVKQVFNFADGRAVLSGRVEGNVLMIQPGQYGLYQGEMLIREVEVEGEMMPRTAPGVREERAVAIVTRIGLPSGETQKSLTLVALGHDERTLEKNVSEKL